MGNWAGVTVEKKEGNVKNELHSGGEKLRVVDLPGAYSISPFTSEESITSSFIKDEKPDVIINIVDATNLSRSLYFTTQLLELGIPLVIALNKTDLLSKKGISIKKETLEKRLGCQVVETVSVSGQGMANLAQAAMAAAGKVQHPAEDTLVGADDKERFAFVNKLVKEAEFRQVESVKQTRQDAVDRIVAHKFWGIPIFALVIYAVFSISQSYLGPFLADIFVGWIDQLYGLVEGTVPG